MQIVVVEWIDVLKRMNDVFDEHKSIDDQLANMKTVGWLYKQTKDTILLVQELDNDEEGAAALRDWITIPKALIKKTTYMVQKGAQDGGRDNQ